MSYVLVRNNKPTMKNINNSTDKLLFCPEFSEDITNQPTDKAVVKMMSPTHAYLISIGAGVVVNISP